MRTDLDDLNEKLAQSIESLAQDLLGPPKPETRRRKEWKWPDSGGFYVAVRGPDRGCWYHFKGEVGGGPLGLIMREKVLSLPAAISWAKNWLGIPDESPAPIVVDLEAITKREAKQASERAAADAEAAADKSRRIGYARVIRQRTVPIEPGSLADRYLTETRGIPCPVGGWPADTVRFDPRESALVVVMTAADGTVQAVQRIFLTDDAQKITREEAERRELAGVKQTNGVMGGAAVRLQSEAAGTLYLTEGPETALSVHSDGSGETWAMLGGIAKAEPEQLACFQRVVVCLDDDAEGSASYLAIRARLLEWRAAGINVLTATPWAVSRGDKSDFNDVLREGGPDALRARLAAAVPVDVPAPHYPAPQNTPAEVRENMCSSLEDWFMASVRHAAIEIEWEQRKQDIEAETEVGSGERRRALSTARHQMAHLYGADWKDPGRVELNRAQAGSGKSKKMDALLAGLTDKRIAGMILTPNRDESLAHAERVPGMQVVRGRSAPDPEAEDGRAMCLRSKAAEEVARAGLPVAKVMCGEGTDSPCKFIGECGYMRDKARNKTNQFNTFVGSHAYAINKPPTRPIDFYIIDENPLPMFFGWLEFSHDFILPNMANGTIGHKETGAPLATVLAYRAIMSKIKEGVTHEKGVLFGLREQGFRSAEEIKPALEYLRDAEKKFEHKMNPAMEDSKIIEHLKELEKMEISTLVRLLEALSVELQFPRDEACSVKYMPDANVTINGKKEKQSRIRVWYRKQTCIPENTPVLLMDAHGNDDLYRIVFGDRLQVTSEIRAERNMRVTQVIDSVMPVRSVLGVYDKDDAGSSRKLKRKDDAGSERKRRDVVGVTNAFLRTHRGNKPGMAISTKAVEEKIAAELDADTLTGHFGKLRSDNSFENCIAGTIISRFQLSLEDPGGPLGMARAFYYDQDVSLNLSEEYETQKRGIRMRDGSTVMVDVQVHPDPRVQAIIEMFRENESEQGVDRLRPMGSEIEKQLLVMSNLPIDVTVDRVVTMNELVYEMTRRGDNGLSGKGRRQTVSRFRQAFDRSATIVPKDGYPPHRSGTNTPQSGLEDGPALRAMPLGRKIWERLVEEKHSIVNGLWDGTRALRKDLDSLINPELVALSPLEIYMGESATIYFATISAGFGGAGRPSEWLVELPPGASVEDALPTIAALAGKPVQSWQVVRHRPAGASAWVEGAPQPEPISVTAPEVELEVPVQQEPPAPIVLNALQRYNLLCNILDEAGRPPKQGEDGYDRMRLVEWTKNLVAVARRLRGEPPL